MSSLYDLIANNEPTRTLYGSVSAYAPIENEAVDRTWELVLYPLLAGRGLFGKIAGKTPVNKIPDNEQIINAFFNIKNPHLEEFPPMYSGNRDISSVLNFLGDNGILKAPNREVIFNNRNLPHYLFENNPERLNDLAKVKSTFERPALIIKGQLNNKDYNYYAKPFLYKNQVKGHLGISRDKDIGNFYQTNFSLRKNKLRDLLNGRQVIYNDLPVSTAPISNDIPVNNIINDTQQNFKSSLFQRIIDYFK